MYLRVAPETYFQRPAGFRCSSGFKLNIISLAFSTTASSILPTPLVGVRFTLPTILIALSMISTAASVSTPISVGVGLT